MTITYWAIIWIILCAITVQQITIFTRGEIKNVINRDMVESLMKILRPLQLLILVFEGDNAIYLLLWKLIKEMMHHASKDCPFLMLFINSNDDLMLHTALDSILSGVDQVELITFEKF